jgi:hypothetical protein
MGEKSGWGVTPFTDKNKKNHRVSRRPNIGFLNTAITRSGNTGQWRLRFLKRRGMQIFYRNR